jgi:hypothetical protein
MFTVSKRQNKFSDMLFPKVFEHLRNVKKNNPKIFFVIFDSLVAYIFNCTTHYYNIFSRTKSFCYNIKISFITILSKMYSVEVLTSFRKITF